MDSHEVVNLLLAFLAQEGEGRKTEELEYETKELRQLVRDMLFRLRRMDLLVLQLLQVRSACIFQPPLPASFPCSLFPCPTATRSNCFI